MNGKIRSRARLKPWGRIWWAPLLWLPRMSPSQNCGQTQRQINDRIEVQKGAGDMKWKTWWTALMWGVGTLLWERALMADVILHRGSKVIILDASWLALSMHGACYNIMHLRGRCDLRKWFGAVAVAVPIIGGMPKPEAAAVIVHGPVIDVPPPPKIHTMDGRPATINAIVEAAIQFDMFIAGEYDKAPEEEPADRDTISSEGVSQK